MRWHKVLKFYGRSGLSPSLGYTLVELMLVILISSIILAGAIQVEVSFHKAVDHQENISNLQSSLDTLRAYLTKHLQQIGSGLGATVTYYDCQNLHNGEPVVMVHNKNDWNPPKSDNTEGDYDYDPDWLEYVVLTKDALLDAVSTTTTGTVYNTTAIVNGSYTDLSRHNFYDVMAYTFNGRSCLFRVTSMKAASSTPPLTTRIYHKSSGAWGCTNTSQAWSACFPGAGASVNPSKPFTVTFLGLYPIRALRVDTTTYARPTLMMGYRPMYRGRGNWRWYPVFQGIEDMQVAYHVDLSTPMDGQGDLWLNTRDLRPTEYGRVVALRISLVMRSDEQTSRLPSRRPALEDRPAGSWDRYVRRTTTFVVKLRSRPIQGGEL